MQVELQAHSLNAQLGMLGQCAPQRIDNRDAYDIRLVVRASNPSDDDSVMPDTWPSEVHREVIRDDLDPTLDAGGMVLCR
jgi:hypothetical protein